MARINNLTNYLTDVATAIKTKKGDSTPILASDFDTEILNLPSGGGGSYNAYHVASIAERNALTGIQDGDVCVVQGNTLANMTSTTCNNFTSIFLPETVILPEAASYIFTTFQSSSLVSINVNISSTTVNINLQINSVTTSYMYNSQDGINYTLINGTAGEIVLPEPTSLSQWATWNDLIGYFLQIGSQSFDGLFQASIENNTITWNYLEIFIDTNATEIMFDKKVYTSNGIITGTLGTNIASDFTDNNALIYSEAQKFYNTLTPRILTDNNKTIDKATKVIPMKYDGTPLLDLSQLTTMYQLFMSCKSLTSVPVLNTSNVTNMSWAFNGCASLVNFPLLDTSNVTNMGYMLTGCASLVNFPLLDTSSVTSMGNMFLNCTSLTDASLDNILQMCINATNYNGTKKLTSIGITTASYPASRIQALPHYQAFINAGWIIS